MVARGNVGLRRQLAGLWETQSRLRRFPSLCHESGDFAEQAFTKKRLELPSPTRHLKLFLRTKFRATAFFGKHGSTKRVLRGGQDGAAGATHVILESLNPGVVGRFLINKSVARTDAELCETIPTKTAGGAALKYRITIWAAAGFLVASGWAVYFFLKDKDLPIKPLVSALLRLTCPIAIVGLHYPVSIYSSLAANVATYAVIGLVVETLRRQLSHLK